MILKRALLMMLVLCLSASVMTSCGKPDESANSTASVSQGEESSSVSEDDGIFDTSNLFGDETSETQSSNSNATISTSSSNKTTSEEKPTYSQIKEDELSKQPQYIQDAYKKLPNVKTDSEKKLVIVSHFEEKQSQIMALKYGIQCETVVVPFSQIVLKHIQMVNAGQSPDIVRVNEGYNFQLISKQYVQPWNKYLDVNHEMFKDAKPYNDQFAFGGQYYLFLHSAPSVGNGMLVVYNKKLIKDARLQTPTELFESGKWDWAALGNIAEKLTVSPNQFGAYFYKGPLAYVYSTGNDYINFVNGKPKNMVNDANIARAVQAYSELVQKKCVYFPEDAVAKLKKGNLAMVVGNMTTVVNCKNEIVKGELDFVPFPRDVQADKYYAMADISSVPYLAKGAKHPNNAAALMYSLCVENNEDYKRAFNEQQLKEGRGTPWEIFDTSNKISKNLTPVLSTWTMFGTEVAQAVSSVGGNLEAGMPWSKNAALFSPIVDSGIKKFYGN